MWARDRSRRPERERGFVPDVPVLQRIENGDVTFRHSTITDPVVSGMDLLTVAQLSETSVEMTEKHCGHFRPKRGASTLASLAL